MTLSWDWFPCALVSTHLFPLRLPTSLSYVTSVWSLQGTHTCMSCRTFSCLPSLRLMGWGWEDLGFEGVSPEGNQGVSPVTWERGIRVELVSGRVDWEVQDDLWIDKECKVVRCVDVQLVKWTGELTDTTDWTLGVQIHIGSECGHRSWSFRKAWSSVCIKWPRICLLCEDEKITMVAYQV